MTDTELSRNIRRARILSGMSLSALRDKHGLDRSVVNNWELGYRTPNVQSLDRLAAALGCKVEYFFTGDEQYLPKSLVDLKPVPEFDGYFAGSDGIIYSVMKGPLSPLKGKTNPRDKYLRVELHRDGKHCPRTVHSVIALAYLGPRPEGFTVSHKNGNSRDNRPANLTYETLIDNNSRKGAHGTLMNGANAPWAKLTWEQVAEIRARLAQGESALSLSRHFKISDAVIRNIKHGRSYREQ